MLAEHVSSASIEALQRRLISGRWENDDGIDGVPDIVKQLIEEGKIPHPLSCADFQDYWFLARNRVYVDRGDPEPADVALGIHERSCHTTICKRLSEGSEYLRKATTSNPRKNAHYIKDLQKWVKTERAKLNNPPIVVNPIPFR